MSWRDAEDALDMDKIVELLKARGIPAWVEQTGGGCATIQAGQPYIDEAGDERFPALAGPGWFAGPGWTRGRGSPGDFWIGPDDDGETDAVMSDQEIDSEEKAADRIAEVVRMERRPK